MMSISNELWRRIIKVAGISFTGKVRRHQTKTKSGGDLHEITDKDRSMTYAYIKIHIYNSTK